MAGGPYRRFCEPGLEVVHTYPDVHSSVNTALAKDQSYGHKSTVREAEEHWIPSQMPIKKKSSLPPL